MSRIITAPHIGIEKLSAISLEELSCGLPERYALPPDGHPVEPHLERLYPTAQSKRSLWDFASPAIHFMITSSSRLSARTGYLAVTANHQSVLRATSCRGAA